MNEPDAGVRPFHLAVYSDATALGGAEMVLARVLAALPAHIRVTLLAVDPAVLDWLAGHRPGAATHHVPAVTGRADIAGMVRHRRIFRRLGADVLQFNLSSASSCQWAILAAATLPRVRLVALEHSPMGSWSSFSTRLKGLTARRLAAHVAVGERAARLIEDTNRLPPGSIRVIHHGIGEVEDAPVERPEGPTLITVSRHDPVKGIDVLLRAMAKVPPPIRAVVIGSGSEGGELRRLRAELGLEERVELREPPAGEMNAAAMMWAYDGLVLPSRLEGFPVTVLEAMFAGLPVIATEVGSVREQVVEGTTGWIVPPEDPDAMASAISELCEDLDRARAMGARGREIARERFTIDATVQAYMDLYEAILPR